MLHYSENKAFYSVSKLHMIFETPASGRYGPGCVNSKKSEFNTYLETEMSKTQD